MTTPRLGAPELTSGQATPETTVNEALYWLDAASIGGFKVIDRDLSTPPTSPAQGDCYILSAAGSGAWSAGADGDVALYFGTAWELRSPDDGWEAWVVDEAVKVGYSTGTWGIIGTFDGAAYVSAAGDTMTGALEVPADPYDATGWDGSAEVPTKGDVRDAIEAVAGGGDLLSTNNLSDLASPATARTNLGLGSIAVEDEATAAQIKAGTASKAVAADKLMASAAPQTLTDAAPTAWDMSLGYNAKWTLGASRTLSTPTNPVVGMTYCLAVIQDATGSRTVTWPSAFDWGTTGAPTLTATASKRDRITLFCTDASTPKFDAFLSGKGFS